MQPHNMLRLARLTRPFFRYRTPVIHRLLKWLVRLLCPPARPGRGRQLVAPFDGGLIHVDTSSSLEYHILFRGSHEPEIVNLIRQVVRPGDICFDVGANVGFHTLLLARQVGPSGRVIALEPHPDVGRRLLENVALNRLDQVTVVPAALSDRDGAADFFSFGEAAFHQGISSLLPDDEATRKIQVRTISGQTLLRAFPVARCDFLKIDVEGVESVVLAQLSGLIERYRPAIICEYRRQHWAKFGHTLEEVRERLHKLGYRLYVIRKNATQPLIGEAPESCELFCVPVGTAAGKDNHSIV
jgi:FkbM family methyltransferase